MKRNFTPKEKRAVGLIEDRDPSEHDADHIKPHSKGGSTDVANAQLLPPEANRKKGADSLELRPWQEIFMQKWDARTSGQPFLLIAIPGGGKTIAALYAAWKWMQAGNDRRVIVAAPTENLREQWRDEAAKHFGVQLQTQEFGANFKHGFQGCAICYASISSNRLILRKLCSSAPTMVIMDEPHHCGEQKSYGEGIKEAFGPSKEKLLLSGTPWQEDGTPVAFVKYDADGFPEWDYRYDYPSALKENVVRYLTFTHQKAGVTYDSSGETLELHSELSKAEARNLLSRVIDAKGDFARFQIREANAKLEEIRRTTPDAAGMVACRDQSHAALIADVIKQETGYTPSVIVSDDSKTNDSVSAFRKASSPWLVSVRKVSEGTDIKRLQVLCWLTNTCTELFFRQLIGRVSRVRDPEEREEAHVFLPADPRLALFAQNIENAQARCIREEIESGSDGDREAPERTGDVESYSTTATGVEMVYIGNMRYTAHQAAAIERAATAAGVTQEQAAKVISACGGGFQEAPNQTATAAEEEPLEVQEKKLRAKVNSKAFYLAKKLNVDPPEIHKRWPKRQKEMSMAELREKLGKIEAELRQVKS